MLKNAIATRKTLKAWLAIVVVQSDLKVKILWCRTPNVSLLDPQVVIAFLCIVCGLDRQESWSVDAKDIWCKHGRESTLIQLKGYVWRCS